MPPGQICRRRASEHTIASGSSIAYTEAQQAQQVVELPDSAEKRPT